MVKKVIPIQRDSLSDLQDMMWTAGHVMSAIINTRGIEEIEQTLFRPIDDADPLSNITAIGIIVRPKYDMSVYQLARVLRDKIKKAQKNYEYEYDERWQAFVFVDYLTSENKKYGGVDTDIWDRPTVTIKIEAFGK
ncbi:MAG: hypothetical protein ACTSWQ_00590 [Candidatus Thorarchaeota archaeon]